MVAHDLDDPHTQTDMTMSTQPLPQTKKEMWINRLKRTPHGLKELVFGGRHFCCCIPTRFGVVVGSCLQFLVAGVLAVILWFEVHTQHDFTFDNFDRIVFICAGVLETLLFFASILGFIGAIVRKQLFVTIYCGFLYVHFFINLGAASALTWKINHTTSTDERVACEEALKDPGSQAQCKDLLGVTKGVLEGIIWFVIVIEFYGMLIVTRYTRQLRNEKRHGRGATYTSLESATARRHSRVASRNLVLTGDGSPTRRDGGSKSPMRTPGSGGSNFKSPGATFFPLTPAVPVLGYGAEKGGYSRDSEEPDEDTLVGSGGEEKV